MKKVFVFLQYYAEVVVVVYFAFLRLLLSDVVLAYSVMQCKRFFLCTTKKTIKGQQQHKYKYLGSMYYADSEFKKCIEMRRKECFQHFH